MMKLKIWSMLIVVLGILAASGSQVKAAPIVSDPEVVFVRQSDTMSHRVAFQTSKKSVCGYTLVGKTVELYEQLKGPKGFLGCPTSNTKFVGDYLGLYTNFQGGVIYAHPVHGAHEVHGAILDLWHKNKGALGSFGYPISNEENAPGSGQVSYFEHGLIYWHLDTGPIAVRGDIYQKYRQLGGLNGFLGVPTRPESIAQGHGFQGIGVVNHFANGSIYGSPYYGAHEVHGGIRNTWFHHGAERGPFGFPMSDELRHPTGLRYSIFRYGMIGWYRGLGTKPVLVHDMLTQELSKLGKKTKAEGRAYIHRVLPHMSVNGRTYQNVVHIRHRVKGVSFPEDQVSIKLDFFVALDFEKGQPCARVLKVDADGDAGTGWDILLGLGEIMADFAEGIVNDSIKKYQNGQKCIGLP